MLKEIGIIIDNRFFRVVFEVSQKFENGNLNIIGNSIFIIDLDTQEVIKNRFDNDFMVDKNHLIISIFKAAPLMRKVDFLNTIAEWKNHSEP